MIQPTWQSSRNKSIESRRSSHRKLECFLLATSPSPFTIAPPYSSDDIWPLVLWKKWIVVYSNGNLLIWENRHPMEIWQKIVENYTAASPMILSPLTLLHSSLATTFGHYFRGRSGLLSIQIETCQSKIGFLKETNRTSLRTSQPRVQWHSVHLPSLHISLATTSGH